MLTTGDVEDVEFREEPAAAEPQKRRARSPAASAKARRRRVRREQEASRPSDEVKVGAFSR